MKAVWLVLVVLMGALAGCVELPTTSPEPEPLARFPLSVDATYVRADQGTFTFQTPPEAIGVDVQGATYRAYSVPFALRDEDTDYRGELFLQEETLRPLKVTITSGVDHHPTLTFYGDNVNLLDLLLDGRLTGSWYYPSVTPNIPFFLILGPTVWAHSGVDLPQNVTIGGGSYKISDWMDGGDQRRSVTYLTPWLAHTNHALYALGASPFAREGGLVSDVEDEAAMGWHLDHIEIDQVATAPRPGSWTTESCLRGVDWKVIPQFGSAPFEITRDEVLDLLSSSDIYQDFIKDHPDAFMRHAGYGRAGQELSTAGGWTWFLRITDPTGELRGDEYTVRIQQDMLTDEAKIVDESVTSKLFGTPITRPAHGIVDLGKVYADAVDRLGTDDLQILVENHGTHTQFEGSRVAIRPNEPEATDSELAYSGSNGCLISEGVYPPQTF